MQQIKSEGKQVTSHFWSCSVKIHDTCEIAKWPCSRLCKNPILLGMLQSSRDLAHPCVFCTWPISIVDSRCAGCKRQRKTRAMHPQWGSSAQMKTLEKKWHFLHRKIKMTCSMVRLLRLYLWPMSKMQKSESSCVFWMPMQRLLLSLCWILCFGSSSFKITAIM